MAVNNFNVGSFEATELEYTPLVDMNVLANAYTNVQNRHDKTIEKTSAIYDALSKLPVHESDQDVIYNATSQISNILDSGVESIGDRTNAGKAYDNIMLKSASIVNSPEIKSAVKANADYEKFKADLNARTDISDEDKKYYNDMNVFTRDLIKDNTGNVVGKGEFKTTINPMESFDGTTLIEDAVKFAAEESAKSESNKITADGLYDTTSSYGYKRKTAQTISESIDVYFKANPAKLDSFFRDYDIKIHNYNSGRVSKEVAIQQGIIDENGVIVGKTKFKDNFIKDAANVSDYNNKESKSIKKYVGPTNTTDSRNSSGSGNKFDGAKISQMNKTTSGTAKIPSKIDMDIKFRNVDKQRNIIANQFKDLSKNGSIDFPKDKLLDDNWITTNFNIEIGSNEYNQIRSRIADYNVRMNEINDVRNNVTEQLSLQDGVDYTSDDVSAIMDFSNGVKKGNNSSKFNIDTQYNEVIQDLRDNGIRFAHWSFAPTKSTSDRNTFIDKMSAEYGANWQTELGIEVDGSIIKLKDDVPANENLLGMFKIINEINPNNETISTFFNNPTVTALNQRGIQADKISQVDVSIPVTAYSISSTEEGYNMEAYADGDLKGAELSRVNAINDSAISDMIVQSSFDDLVVMAKNTTDGTTYNQNVTPEQYSIIKSAIANGDATINLATAEGLTKSITGEGVYADAGFIVTIDRDYNTIPNTGTKLQNAINNDEVNETDANKPKTIGQSVSFYIGGDGLYDEGLAIITQNPEFKARGVLNNLEDGNTNINTVFGVSGNGTKLTPVYNNDGTFSIRVNQFDNPSNVKIAKEDASTFLGAFTEYSNIINTYRNSGTLNEESFNAYKSALIDYAEVVLGNQANAFINSINHYSTSVKNKPQQ